MRREFLKRAAAVSAAAAVAPLALAQADWPNRPINLLIPFPPGGAVDPPGRALATSLPSSLGQPVVAINRPGASTGIATAELFRAAPDGYTILINPPATHILHTMQAQRGYDPLKDFTPIATVSRGDWVMVVNNDLPVKTVPELIAYAKANPDKLNAGVAGLGNSDQLGTELFKMVTGIKFTIVPYKGSSDAAIDLIAGRVQMMIVSNSVVQKQIEAGNMRLLAYINQPTVKTQVPSFAQLGLKGFDTFGTVLMILGPARMPAPIVDKLTNAIKRALETPETKTMLARASQVPFYEPPDVLRERLVSTHALFTDVVKSTGIKFE